MTRPLGRSGLAVIICALVLSCSRLHARSLDLNGSRGQRVFFVLGFLAEYTGRHVVEGD
jgi:hypothetical protein